MLRRSEDAVHLRGSHPHADIAHDRSSPPSGPSTKLTRSTTTTHNQSGSYRASESKRANLARASPQPFRRSALCVGGIRLTSATIAEPHAVSQDGTMTSYARPSIDSAVFRDGDGQIIDFGNRWNDSPPEDAYSVDTHPERFAPLHIVADALIGYLRYAYDVEVIEAAETTEDLLRPPSHDVLRSVRIRPNDPSCASLTLVFTSYPGVYLHAGILHDFHYPACGCDACDSTWQSEADDLEQQVLAVVTGNYRESIGGGRQPVIEFACTYPNGSSSSQSGAEDFPADRLEAAKLLLRDLTEGWAAWPESPTSLKDS